MFAGEESKSTESAGSRWRQSAEQGGEGQGLSGELHHTFSHLPGSWGRGVLQGGPLDGQNGFFQGLAQGTAGGPYPRAYRPRGCQAGNRVPHEDQFVCRDDDKFAMGHEDSGRLVGGGTGEEGLNGRKQGGVMGLALPRVEVQELAVLWRRWHLENKEAGQSWSPANTFASNFRITSVQGLLPFKPTWSIIKYKIDCYMLCTAFSVELSLHSGFVGGQRRKWHFWLLA